ncbi:GNAT family N-acetyltransferase [Undibacterium arcticum]|uniref:GNAT family N-acetyltransferase n=2 Tax=Undibacterium arcticum TaxID=1762892 RepID=A0ABV7EY56_9BURK
MTPFEIYADFAADRCRRPLDGFTLESGPHLTRYTALRPDMEGFVTFASLPGGEELAQIRAQPSHFAALAQRFEWKVYALDQPAGLRGLLEAEGFCAGPDEGFMVFPIDPQFVAPTISAAAVSVRRVVDIAGLRDIVAIQEQVWQQPFPWLLDQLTDTLAQQSDQFALYCAYHGARPVGSGWLDLPPGSRYAELHGGAVLPEMRQQGIYARLFDARLAHAAQRGIPFFAVDASPMSRPILERRGFVHVCNTYPMRKPT